MWAGEIDKLSEKMRLHQNEIGRPIDQDDDSSPRQLLPDAIRYVTNQKDRMTYAEYRQLGLPITSAYIESTIKQINRRGKGSEKFWSVNANPMLQLRADAISQTQQLQKFGKVRG